MSTDAVEHLAVLKDAILMELEGKNFFERAVDTVQNQRSKDTFSSLVQQEVKHIEVLSREYERLSSGDSWLSLYEASRKGQAVPQLSVFKDPRLKRIKLRQEAGELEVLALGIEVEKKSIEYYSAALKGTDDPKAKEIYRWLVGEESGHLTILSAEHDYRRRSGYYYDNQEFSLEVE